MAVNPGRSSSLPFVDVHLRKKMKELAQYTQIIKQQYPDLDIFSARFNQDGQYNDVVILNDSLVFRFAKVPDAIKTLRHEIIVQKSLPGCLPLQIPEPMYASLETDIPGQTFIGYPMIQRSTCRINGEFMFPCYTIFKKDPTVILL